MGNKKWRKYWHVLTSNNIGIVGLGLLIIFLAIAVFAPLLAPFDPTERVGTPFTKPNSQFLLGTNDVGQDILSELLYGTRISLLIGVLAAFISILLGCLIGVISGYYGGKVDALLMRLVDLVLVIPFLPLMILLAAFIGPSFWNIILVISLISWASPARVIRSQVLTLKTKGYVEAAKSIGTNIKVILGRHILPGVIPIALSQFVLAASHSILIEASLSFLGLGDPFTKSWGTILYYAQARGAFLTDAWVWWILPPGLLITTLVIGFAFTGYSLEEVMNPRLRRGR
ncbi:ABC transporter permease [Bacillus sp. ISL-35]|uniref:ABC transporter permease n=1 Tax=unclassified Bacillus (in: firmicutes) TaxID=185979 RepID=UPI001BE9F4D2|nr:MULTISPECIES: ABC transporter permease [unclassified Bacillus (in: firmicutes)]MBT2640194.1 ABC transporter permease [Bacillus sp. ISL-39]MBT2679580.1 ABC transporter permease [Bacillus sp. ISL-35]MBT2703484.1 ABC transporter permease [Chryseobacterium sp. ISL-80]